MTEEGLERVRHATSIAEIDRIVSDEEFSGRPLAIGTLLVAALFCVLQATTGAILDATLEFSSVEAVVVSLAGYLLVGLLGSIPGTLLSAMVISCKEVLTRRRLVRWLDAEAWRPRAGMRHPRGRVDTEPRYMIERRIDGAEVEVGLRRWTYDKVWRPDPVLAFRRFTADELDAADVYAEGLLEDAERETRPSASLGPVVEEGPEDREGLERGHERLLSAWVSERDEQALLAGGPR